MRQFFFDSMENLFVKTKSTLEIRIELKNSIENNNNIGEI